MDYFIDEQNEQNEEENPLQSATSDPGVPNVFEYVNPLVEFIFQFLHAEPTKYEIITPLKRVRENKVYTTIDCVLGGITRDGNGVYNGTNKVKHDYYVVVDEDGVQAIK